MRKIAFSCLQQLSPNIHATDGKSEAPWVILDSSSWWFNGNVTTYIYVYVLIMSILIQSIPSPAILNFRPFRFNSQQQTDFREYWGWYVSPIFSTTARDVRSERFVIIYICHKWQFLENIEATAHPLLIFSIINSPLDNFLKFGRAVDKNTLYIKEVKFK